MEINSEEEPVPILGEIFADDEKMGELVLYELHNDTDFFDQCDALHGDFAVIAAAICEKSGAVLKKYVPDISQYESIYLGQHYD